MGPERRLSGRDLLGSRQREGDGLLLRGPAEPKPLSLLGFGEFKRQAGRLMQAGRFACHSEVCFGLRQAPASFDARAARGPAGSAAAALLRRGAATQRAVRGQEGRPGRGEVAARRC